MATFAIEHSQVVERTLVVAVEAENVAAAIAIVSGMELDQEDWEEVFSETRVSTISQWSGNAHVLTMTAEMVWGNEDDSPSLGEDPQRAQAVWDHQLLEKNTSKAKGKRKQGRL